MDQEVQGLYLVSGTNMSVRATCCQFCQTITLCPSCTYAPMLLCIPITSLTLDGSPQFCGAAGTSPTHTHPLSCQPAHKGSQALIKQDTPIYIDQLTLQGKQGSPRERQKELPKQLQGSRATGDDRSSAVHGESLRCVGGRGPKDIIA